MVLGRTGCGKTTTLNSMMNYLWGVEFDDKHRYKLIHDDLELKDDGTVDVTAYHLAPPKVDFELTVIDTPGFGQVDFEKDVRITKKIKEVIDKLHGIDAICLVATGSFARLSLERQYKIDQFLNLFGNDIKENVFILFTFADGGEPPALPVVRKRLVPYKKWFQLNNSAYGVNIVEEKNDCDESHKMFAQLFWKMGMQSFDKLFTSIAQCETNSLMKT
eukprot:272097_1